MRLFLTVLVVVACLIAGVLAAAVGSAAGNAQPAASESRTADRITAPVAVPEPSDKAMDYYYSGNLLWIVSQFFGLAIPAVILFTGLSARLRNAARVIGRKWFFTVAVYFVFYSVLQYAIAFPLTYYAGFIRPHLYDLSNQTFQKWFVDSLKGLAIGVVFGCLLLWVPYLLVRRSPRRWWLYTSLLAIPVMVFTMLIEPIWIEPMFNRFEPLKDKQLESRILSLAQRAGIEGSHVFEVDKSVDTKTVNAYVTGLFGTKRIVLWDTLLAKLDTDQILFVMAHEMGHYVLHHVFLGIVVGAVGVLVGLFLVHRLSDAVIGRLKKRFGFEELSDVASLPLVFLLVQLISLALCRWAWPSAVIWSTRPIGLGWN